jgi:hypothetical protein
MLHLLVHLDFSQFPVEILDNNVGKTLLCSIRTRRNGANYMLAWHLPLFCLSLGRLARENQEPVVAEEPGTIGNPA